MVYPLGNACQLIGEVCTIYHIWSFVGSKQNIPAERVGDPNYDEVWK